jgi:hypothetical protein
MQMLIVLLDSVMVAYQEDPAYGFTPIPELFSPNGSTVLMFADFNGAYTNQSDDPWLSAHQTNVQSYRVNGGAVQNRTLYTFDNPISTLGCVEKHQVCNPNRPADSAARCTPFVEFDAMNYTDILDTTHQNMVAEIIFYAVQGAELSELIHLLPSPLLALDKLGYTISQGLPANQWILETSNCKLQFRIQSFRPVPTVQ